MKITATAIIFWLACGIVTISAVLAQDRNETIYHYIDDRAARNRCANLLGGGLIMGAPGLIISPFITGFYQHGFTLSCTKL